MTYNHSHFEFLLRDIRFTHDPVRPPVDQYSAYVQVTASDRQLTSETATTRVDISVANFDPIIFIDGQTDVSVEMRDGMPVVELLRSMQPITVLEDTPTISRVSIILTNSQHSDERISISSPNLPANIEIISTDMSILLVGPASPQDFSMALSEAVLQYHYPRMDSILQGDEPNFTPR